MAESQSSALITSLIVVRLSGRSFGRARAEKFSTRTRKQDS